MTASWSGPDSSRLGDQVVEVGIVADLDVGGSL